MSSGVASYGVSATAYGRDPANAYYSLSGAVVPPTPGGTTNFGGVNGTAGGNIPANTSTTPILSYTITTTNDTININASAQVVLTNAQPTNQDYTIYLYEGVTPGTAWGTTVVPAGHSLVVSPVRYFEGVTGGAITINLLVRNDGAADPAETYANASINAVWGAA